MIDIRLPNITAPTESGQLAQIRSYLYQFAEQLKWAFNTLENGGESQNVQTIAGGSSATATTEADKDKWTKFDELKEVIIKSADIVEAYYKEIDKLIETEGKYVATSDFGTYYEESSQEISAKYDSLEGYYTELQKVVDALGETVAELKTDAEIKLGKIKYAQIGNVNNVPIYGLQVGQSTLDEDGNEVFERLSQYTTLGLELYADPLDAEPTAFFGLTSMKTTNAEIKGILTHGGYQIDSTNGLVYKWVGRS